MSERERLIALLKGNLPYHSNGVAYWQDEHVGALADHLIAHGVTIEKRSHWVEDDYGWARCAECGGLGTATWSRCPKCEAKMEVKKSD